MVGAATLLVSASADAGSVTANRSQVTFINEHNPDNNMGACGYWLTGKGGGRMRTLIQFSVPTNLQTRVNVTGVSLAFTTTLNLFGGHSGAAGAGYSLFKIGSPWGQGNKACAQVGGGYLSGAACSAGEATWNEPDCNGGTAWTGGDLSGGASSNLSGPGWSGCPGSLCTDVQGWLNTASSNHGWALVSASEGVLSAERVFVPASMTVNFVCSSSIYKDIGTSCTTCTDVATSACVTTCPSTGGTCIAGNPSGNVCNDPGAPATNYVCSCANPAYTGSGTMACVDKNECLTNHCTDSGDTNATCTDHVAPATGYDCTCDTGYKFDGVSCVSLCGNGADPCGNGGTCTIAGGGWTCSCPTGFVSSGGVQATCVDFDACNAAALTDCTTVAGNSCVDEAPPSLLYHCDCGNAAFVAGTGADGKPACVDKNECVPNQCLIGGDGTAVCVDHVAPAVGYDCTCSSAFWTLGAQGGVATCVDKDECAGANPCVNGVCTNVPAGGGYSCACNSGYASTGGKTPTCVLVPPDAGPADSGSGADSGPPGVDAGGGDSSTKTDAAGEDGGGGADAGGGGCSCRSTPVGWDSNAPWLAGFSLALLGVRRRRRRARDTVTSTAFSDSRT